MSQSIHVKHLEQVLERLHHAGLQLKRTKCHFYKLQIGLLGYVVNENWTQPHNSVVEAILNLEPPPYQTPVRSFLGMAGYYCQCIPGFTTLAVSTELTKPKKAFKFGNEQQEAFEKLKEALTQARILAHPDMNGPYVLYTDTSNKYIGAILVQRNYDGVERVIHFVSHKLSETQLHWLTIKKEAYAIIHALKKLHPYLCVAQFEIHIDHMPLKSLFMSAIENLQWDH